ncbi:Esterase OVCA2 [Halotydeus destructor]|nr:Esterase OVCA2 [Halotydeus destructor]
MKGEQNPDNSDSFRSWWFSETDPFDAFYSIKDSEIDKGFGDSIDLVKRTVQAEGPFDGILGFSQGASMSAIVCSLQQAGIVDSGFRFAILVSGFKSKTASHAKHYAEQIELPTLHVIGETDRIIEQERSLDLASCFVDPVIIKHPGGHQVPSSSSLKREYFAFLKQFLPEDIL